MDAVGAAKLGATQGSHESSRPLLFPLRREGGEEGRKERRKEGGKGRKAHAQRHLHSEIRNPSKYLSLSLWMLVIS